MGRRKTRVNKLRDIIHYRYTTDLSERQIARALKLSRTVVAKTLNHPRLEVGGFCARRLKPTGADLTVLL